MIRMEWNDIKRTIKNCTEQLETTPTTPTTREERRQTDRTKDRISLR